MEEKQAEKLPLPVIGIVLGATGLALSWIPVVNLLGFSLAIVGLILVGVSFYVNRQGKKVLTYIGLGLTLVAAIVSMTLHVTYAKLATNVSKAVATEIEKEDDRVRESKILEDAKGQSAAKATTEKDKTQTIDTPEGKAQVDLSKDARHWTSAYFDKLQVGDELTGKGGAKLADVEKEVGKPSVTFNIEEFGIKAHAASWVNFTDTEDVVLVFVEQDNGDLLLVDKGIEKSDEA